MSGPRSFTVRVPYEIYLQICDIAQRDGKKLNTKVNELIQIGLGRIISVEDALKEMLLRVVADGDNK